MKPSRDPGELILAPVGSATEHATVELPSHSVFHDGDHDDGEIACANAPALTWATVLRTTKPGADPETNRAVVSATRFLRVLRDTRRRTVSCGGKRYTEPLGVAVSIKAFLEGYGGKQVEVRWSLHRATSGKASARAWLVNRRVVKQKVEHDTQPVTAQFWAPLPRRKASSFIRVSLYDAHGAPIAQRDTPHFK